MGRNLLLVEDDAQMREELSTIFQANNIPTRTVGSGEESVALAQEQTFDAILVDVRLPDCNGVDLVRRLRGKQPESIYILMTAYGSLETALQALRYGVQDYVIKPFSPEEILATVRRGFEAKEALSRGQERVEDLQLQGKVLEEKIMQLRKLNQIFIGREERILELKREVNELRHRLGEPSKYDGC